MLTFCKKSSFIIEFDRVVEINYLVLCVININFLLRLSIFTEESYILVLYTGKRFEFWKNSQQFRLAESLYCSNSPLSVGSK